MKNALPSSRNVVGDVGWNFNKEDTRTDGENNSSMEKYNNLNIDQR